MWSLEATATKKRQGYKRRFKPAFANNIKVKEYKVEVIPNKAIYWKTRKMTIYQAYTT